MGTRELDGRFRNHAKPTGLSERTLRARWLEAEVLCLKRQGFSYEVIAQHITEVGRGLRTALTPLPEGMSFSPDYTISAMGCHKAFQRGLRRSPALAADELRRLDTDRCEEMFHSLLPGIRQGDPKAVRAAVQALALKAAINGYRSADNEVKLEPGPSWSSVLSKEQTVDLFKEAITILIQAGVTVGEMAGVAGLEASVVEISATKVEDDGN